MKNYILLSILLVSVTFAAFTSIAHANVQLTPGNFVEIGGQRVSCETGPGQSVPATPEAQPALWNCVANCLTLDFWRQNVMSDRGQMTGVGSTPVEAFDQLRIYERCPSGVGIGGQILGVNVRRDRNGEIRYDSASFVNACLRVR